MPSTTTILLDDLHDPSSAAYKKAKRRHLKTTRNRGDHVDADWTPFRAAEKKFKTRFPPPDLSHVLDIALADRERREEITRGGWKGSADSVVYTEIELEGGSTDSRRRKACIFPSIPGLVLLPAFLSPEEQRDLVRWSLKDHARHPNETNLDTHYLVPEEGLWNAYIKFLRDGSEEVMKPRASVSPPESVPAKKSGPRQLISNEPAGKDNYLEIACAPKPSSAPSQTVKPATVSFLVPKLRWANIGWHYHWGIKQYDFARGKIEVSNKIRDACKRIVSAIRWNEVFGNGEDHEDGWGEDGPDWQSWDESYEPDAGIVNFYQTKDTLMAHVDRSEVCATSPLVSMSLGCAAVFLIGGHTRNVEPIPIFLRSGDVVIMSGPRCRRAYHGVPRILENTLPPHFEGAPDGDDDWKFFEEYLRTTRININVRQVFPKGFDPKLDIKKEGT